MDLACDHLRLSCRPQGLDAGVPQPAHPGGPDCHLFAVMLALRCSPSQRVRAGIAGREPELGLYQTVF